MICCDGDGDDVLMTNVQADLQALKTLYEQNGVERLEQAIAELLSDRRDAPSWLQRVENYIKFEVRTTKTKNQRLIVFCFCLSLSLVSRLCHCHCHCAELKVCHAICKISCDLYDAQVRSDGDAHVAQAMHMRMLWLHNACVRLLYCLHPYAHYVDVAAFVSCHTH